MFGNCMFASEIRAITNFCCRRKQGGWFRAANRGGIGNFDFRKKAVAPTSNGFHKARAFGRVAEGLADFADRFVKPVIEIHKSVRGPEFFLQFLATYHLARML